MGLPLSTKSLEAAFYPKWEPQGGWKVIGLALGDAEWRLMLI